MGAYQVVLLRDEYLTVNSFVDGAALPGPTKADIKLFVKKKSISFRINICFKVKFIS
jgi:hypothetical protein